jgi:hypothetical protein
MVINHVRNQVILWLTNLHSLHSTFCEMQILDNSVTNNEIYVMLCDSVQGMESQLQRLHSVLASLRTLSGELRYLATTDGGGDSTTHVGATGATATYTTQAGETSRLHRQTPGSSGNEFEPPELAQVLPVRICNCKLGGGHQCSLQNRVHHVDPH